jgi:integrase/recombinase XerD
MSTSANEPPWNRYPLTATDPHAKRWIRSCVLLGLSKNTVAAYSYALEDYLAFCRSQSLEILTATRSTITQYVAHLRSRGRRRVGYVAAIDSTLPLSNATLQQRLTAVRLFFEFLLEEGLRKINPVARGHYSVSGRGGRGTSGLLPTFHKLPWIPSEEQWAAVLAIVADESRRNRCMLAFAYDAALRREELCRLRSDDLDPSHRVRRIRAETTKGHRERIVPYSEVTGSLFRQYLEHRSSLSRARGPLFLSESPRNYAAPITLWTWSKVVRSIALRAGVPSSPPIRFVTCA